MYNFFAYISRMKYIDRWSLMRSTVTENIQEHSHMVAVLAHGLAMIQRDILKEPADPDRCAAAALFHDASEILTGDLPTPIKYYNPEIRNAYKAVEAVRAAGGRCDLCLAIFTYGFKTAEDAFAALNPPCVFHTILSYDVMVRTAEETGYISSDSAAALHEWRTDPFGWGEKRGFPREVKA